MLRLTAVAPKEKDNDRHNSPETGIFVTHSPTKTFSKNNCNSMFFNNYTTTLFVLLAVCYILSTIAVAAAAAAAATAASTALTALTKNSNIFKSPPAPHECGSMDLRNNCNDFYALKNCTVITGFLDITYIPEKSRCNFSEHRFENLMEITDFLLIHKVENLTSIKNMFPNLSVIRGQRLMINYALVITAVRDLEKIEFRSLIAIQRGHVIIEDVPKVCFTEKINWTRLTLKPGTNNIFLNPERECPEKAKCTGCKRDSCWSNDVCQKLENDSVISLVQDTKNCHEECLGGCYNRTAQGCAVCKKYTDHGTCVDQCPRDKYISSHFLRCYTREECINDKKLFILNNTCVDFCPGGYMLNNSTKECDPCVDVSKCRKVCTFTTSSEAIFISDIKNAETLRGCQILNAPVIVNIHQYFDQQELMDSLKDVKEIIGYLKINRATYLTSLNFFQNLEKIHGRKLENNLFGLVIYNNKNLTGLWNVKPGFEIVKGGMYIHANDKLCNHRIREFRENTKHDRSLDSFQTSDQEVLCSPSKLNLFVQVLNHSTIKLFWRMNQTLDEVEIIYRSLLDKEKLSEKSEIDTEVCKRIKWNRVLKFAHELQDNNTHYIYMLKNLEPNTRYACLVKTFNGDDGAQDARSELKYVKTQFDIPEPPEIIITSKTYDTLHVEFSSGKLSPAGSQVVDFYLLEVYVMPDDKELLDKRDYCDEPVMFYKDKFDEDYDECCSRREREAHDKMFFSWLKKEFSCSLDKTEYCKRKKGNSNDNTKDRKLIIMQRFEAWENNYAIRSLERFHLYVLQVQACNYYGCSSYSMLSTRTNYSLAGDKVSDFSACKLEKENVYKVSFTEPRLPNGYITSYALHFRYHAFSKDSTIPEHNQLVCISRLDHERNNYVYLAHINYTFNQAALRVHSLGHHTFMDWSNITTCQVTLFSKTFAENWLIILLTFMFASVGIFLLWVCFKRRCCKQIPSPRLLARSPSSTDYAYPLAVYSRNPNEDRHSLVEYNEVVELHSTPEEDTVSLQ